MKKNSIYEPIIVRDGFHNYMCINMEYECPEYEIHMINEHKDSCGMLPMWQGEGMLKYEVEGYTSFDKVLSETEHQYELIRDALTQIVDILNNLDNYLLQEDRVILQFDMVYWSNDSKKVKLCYLSGGEGNIQEQFESLIEAVMRNMNHRDNKLIKLVYGIYHIIREDNYSLKHIENILNEEVKKGQEYYNGYKEGSADKSERSGFIMEEEALDLPQEEKQEMKHKKSDEEIQETLYGKTDTAEKIIIFREQKCTEVKRPLYFQLCKSHKLCQKIKLVASDIIGNIPCSHTINISVVLNRHKATHKRIKGLSLLTAIALSVITKIVERVIFILKISIKRQTALRTEIFTFLIAKSTPRADYYIWLFCFL